MNPFTSTVKLSGTVGVNVAPESLRVKSVITPVPYIVSNVVVAPVWFLVRANLVALPLALIEYNLAALQSMLCLSLLDL